MRFKTLITAVVLATALAACGGSTTPAAPPTSTEAPAPSPPVPEPAPDTSADVCELFRDVALGAYGETMSFAQVEAGLREVGQLAEDATDPEISNLGVQVGVEADARSMIGAKPDRTLDALTTECNEAFPI